jgi:cell division protein FtsI/penicillin-binding protein 2
MDIKRRTQKLFLRIKSMDFNVGAVKELARRFEFDRLNILLLVLIGTSFLIILRLFSLQVVDYGFYAALASNQHEIQAILQADRGDILVRDASLDNKEFAIATEKEYMHVYADPRLVEDPEETAKKLSALVNKSEEELIALLSKEDDPYEPIEKKVSLERFQKIEELELPGVHGLEETHRYYVDDNMGSHVTGFLGQIDDEPTGLYGVEGYFDEILSGTEGYFQTERDVAGRWIVLSDKEVVSATDGADVLLTIDRTLQYFTCKALNNAVDRHGATGGAVVVMHPETGKILSMCSAPGFNPNFYSEVESGANYNNTSIFEAYEPGSIFKPLIMSAAIDLEYVSPGTTYVDTGSIKIEEYTIRNASQKVYGEVNMANVLEDSINTGMIFVSRELGMQNFRDYMERYGFGELTGIELQTEGIGNISSIYKNHELYTATASFGQGITVTPIQMAAAYSAIANGGKLMKPYIVEEIRHPDGSVETRNPVEVRRVLSSRAATLMNGMLTSVVSNGHAGLAKVPGYYIAGKTGTAQIAGGSAGYLANKTNHSFIGYAPADDPEFVIMVKLEKPSSAEFSASTAAPLFGEVAEFALNYYQIEPDY